MTFEVIIGILLAGILSNNYALLHFLGTGAVIENERSDKKSLIIGLGTTLVMVLSTLITWPLNKYLLKNVPYLQTMAFVIVLLIVIELIHLYTKKHLESYCKVDFMKFTINGAVLGLCIHNTSLMFLEALLTAFSVGIGFTLTLIVFSELEQKIDKEAVPKSFRGLPILLLIAGLMALALIAF